MAAEDAQLTRMVQRELGRRHIDYTRTDVKASHGVVYIRGEVRKLRGYDIDIKAELEIIKRIIRSRPGVRGVYTDDVSIK